MQLRGLHHVTAICRDAERTIAFYRDVMGLAVVHDGPSDDDPVHVPWARHHAALARDFGAAEDAEPIYLRLPDAERALRR